MSSLARMSLAARGAWYELARVRGGVFVPPGVEPAVALAVALRCAVSAAQEALGPLLDAGLLTLEEQTLRATRGTSSSPTPRGEGTARAGRTSADRMRDLRARRRGDAQPSSDAVTVTPASLPPSLVTRHSDAASDAVTVTPSSLPSHTLPSPSPSAEQSQKDDVVTGATREGTATGLRLLRSPEPLGETQRLWDAALEGDSGGVLARLCSPDGRAALAELIAASDAATVTVLRDPCRWVLLGALLDPRRGNVRSTWDPKSRRSRVDLAWLTRPGVNGSERQLLRLMQDSEDWYRRENCAPRTPTLGAEERATAARRIKGEVDRIAGRYARREVANG